MVAARTLDNSYVKFSLRVTMLIGVQIGFIVKQFLQEKSHAYNL